MKLHTAAKAPNPRRVDMFLAEKGIDDIERHLVDLNAGQHKEAAFLARNPLARVPVLELDDGRYLAESRAICTYLEFLHPEPNLMGRDGEERAFIEMADRQVEFNLFAAAAPDLVGRGGLGSLGRGAPARVGLDGRELVLLQHVRDLVGQDTGKLGLARQPLHQPVRDDHGAAGHREGVDDLGVDHAEGPRQVRPLGLRGEPAPHAIDVALQALVGIQPDGAQEARGDAVAQGHFLLDGVLLGRLLDLRRDLHGLPAEVDDAADVELGVRGNRGQERQRGEEHPHDPLPT